MSAEAAGTRPLKLHDLFPPVPTDAWEAAIARDLKGADYDKRLVWRPEPGLAFKPYYRRDDLEALGPHVSSSPGEFPFVRGGPDGWEALDTWSPAEATIRADAWHDAGATTVQEVGCAIASGVDRLAALTGDGITPADAAARTSFAFAVGSRYFLEIAKLRAARLLWAQACTAFGVPADGAMMRIDARTSRANKSVYDPYTNMLRVTTEAMAAIIGGCQRLYVEPYGFSAHLAVNVHHVLRDEAHLAAVADAGGGAYYIEALTDGIAREAWSLFQQIEAAGGFGVALEAGTIAGWIAEARASAHRAVALRRQALVGVNNYPNLTDRRPADPPPPLAGVDAESRLAEPFEAIRRRTAAHEKQTGRRPLVLLLKRGDPKMAGARANFSLNFFGCAGFDVAESAGLRDDADLVVLCSADPEYLALAREVVPQAKAPVIVAGNPVDQADALREAGVQSFVHLGSDAVETLTEWQRRLGMERDGQ